MLRNKMFMTRLPGVVCFNVVHAITLYGSVVNASSSCTHQKTVTHVSVFCFV